MLAETTEGFEDVQYFTDEFTEAGDLALVQARRSGRRATSSVRIEERQYHPLELRDGRAVRFRLFLSRADARRAAGLET
jgi:hypothetical protein